MTQSPETLVFDLDGTLVDSAPDLHAALNLVLSEAGRDTVSIEQVTRMIGDGVAKLVARGFDATGGAPDNPDHWLERFHRHYGENSSTLTTVYPDVIEILERLQRAGHRMAVCTNKPLKPAQSVLHSFGLAKFFSAVAGGDSFAVRKPSPGHLLGTLAMLDASPESAIMIGDSPNDVHTALNAAIPVIAVAYGYRRVPAEEMGADILVDRFRDIPDAVTRLRSHTSPGA